jgi:hypothetical protein
MARKPINEMDLVEFMEYTTRQPGGGSFWLVLYRGRKVGSFWGRNAQDINNWLNKQRIPFDHVIAEV